MEPITSEQELKTLLDEGKITPEEYKELLAAMKDKPRQSPAELSPGQDKTKSRLGKAALILFITSLVLPVFIGLVWLLAGRSGSLPGPRLGVILLVPLVLVELLCGPLAFIFGIVAWKTVSGKIAALGALAAFVCAIPVILTASLGIPCVFALRSALPSGKSVFLKSYSLDSLDGLLTKSGVELDENISSDGNGSVRIRCGEGKTTVRLFETGPMDATNTMLWYQASLRCENLAGQAYLEMWCNIPGRGEFFSRGLEQPISGTMNWSSVQIPFRNDTAIKPDNVKLNLVVEGTGTIWIDDIRVTGQSLL